MKEELEIKLVKKYPKILRDYHGDIMQTALYFGCQNDDGWFNILDECMAKLQYFCELCSSPDNEVDVIATTIKEKYGRLCFYYDVYGADELQYSIIEDIIDAAERKSKHTCEITGEWGEPCHRGGWYKTLCYQEARKLGYKACDESTEKYWKEKDGKPLYAYKHKPTNTWVYFLPNRNVIGLSLKADATTFSNLDELKHKITTCSFNGVENYCKDNLLEFEMVEVTKNKNDSQS